VSSQRKPEPHVTALLKALKPRIEGLGDDVVADAKESQQHYRRGEVPFLRVEVKRDHLIVDLWLDEAQASEARSSGIARSHPFIGDSALMVRFERAQDLAKVARWIEASYLTAPERA
jgi:hypothetical protein